MATNSNGNKTAQTLKNLRAEYRVELAMIAAFFLLCLGLSIVTSRFLTPGNIGNLFWQGTTVGIVAIGMTFIILTGGIDLSVGAVAALSSMLGGMVVMQYGVGLGVPAIFLMGALLGLVNGFLVSYFQLAPFIVTLGMMSIARSLTYVSTNGHSLTGLPKAYRFLGYDTIGGFQVYTIIFIGLFVVGHIVLTKTKLGRFWYAIGSNEEAARLAGVRVRLYKSLAYVVTGLLSAVAVTILTSRLGAVDPDTGVGLEMDAIASVVIGGCSLSGGKGSLIGTFIGVCLITVLHNGLNLIGVSPFWQGSAIGVVIVVSVLMDKLLRRR
ncbi:MAG: ABC transporter permease [Treponemataceae bacterium]